MLGHDHVAAVKALGVGVAALLWALRVPGIRIGRLLLAIGRQRPVAIVLGKPLEVVLVRLHLVREANGVAVATLFAQQPQTVARVLAFHEVRVGRRSLAVVTALPGAPLAALVLLGALAGVSAAVAVVPVVRRIVALRVAEAVAGPARRADLRSGHRGQGQHEQMTTHHDR